MVMPHPKTAAPIVACSIRPRSSPIASPIRAASRSNSRRFTWNCSAPLSQHHHALVELPRDHGKSTQICGRVLWELGRNPSLRIKIVCATDAIAAERSRFLRDAIENSDALHAIFPALNATSPWSADAFTIVRPGDVIGPSVAALGVGAGSTGTRADLLICDDAVDVRSIHSKAERDRVADYFTNNLMNLLEPEGRCWVLFTPWHLDDLNARLKRNGCTRSSTAPSARNWSRSGSASGRRFAWQRGKNEIGTASFCSRISARADLGRRNADPPGVGAILGREPAKYERVILSVDPAVSGAAKADRSALVVIGRAPSLGLAPSPTPPPGGEGLCFAPPSPLGKGAGGLGLHVLSAIARRVPAPTGVAHRRLRSHLESVGDPVRIERGLPGDEGPAGATNAIRPEAQERDANQKQGRTDRGLLGRGRERLHSG